MALYLADTSAWHRSRGVFGRWSRLMAQGDLAVCVPVVLELLYSARGPRDFLALQDHLEGLPRLPLDETVAVAAGRTQAALAARGQHRGPKPVDLLIAAVAEAHGAVLLHYERHFDQIARVTGQSAEWISRPGSLD